MKSSAPLRPDHDHIDFAVAALEHAPRSRQSGTDVSAPYRSRLGGIGLGLMLGSGSL
jgi:hypothetical protein